MVAEHPMWLPPETAAILRGRSLAVVGEAPLLDTVRGEAAAGGVRLVGDPARADVVIVAVEDALRHLDVARAEQAIGGGLGEEGFAIVREGSRVVVVFGGAPGALYGWFAVIRAAVRGGLGGEGIERHLPARALRMLDHWDNVDVHPVMGQVERGYAGGSIFFADGAIRDDLERVGRYARLLASIGVNRVAINNVNVHRRESLLLTDDLHAVAEIAARFRAWGVRIHLSVSFASPVVLGGLDSADPLDPAVVRWWQGAAARVYDLIPDFGGFVVKADSEGQPGPFAYGRTHADGANAIARAVAPHGGVVHWRAFVYDHRQDWRDRRTDRARAAHDHFAPLDGAFDEDVVLQVKAGPMDFQVREPVSPVIAAMRATRVALEVQITQEYTGQQRHAVYLGPQWREILDFAPHGESGPRIGELADGGVVAVANVGDDPFWTGHPLAQANLYAYGRLAWDDTLDPRDVLDEWIALTVGTDEVVREVVHDVLDDSWANYEAYTAPLGVGFMVTPHTHDGPSVDGYEYSPWGTYHFADRDGIGVDRTAATGTGYAGQYPEPWRTAYESPATTPDELLLFFHHVPYTHRLRSGKTVIQHIYDTHFAGVERVERAVEEWRRVEGRVDAVLDERVRARLAEQVRRAREWRDQINTYFLRKSGIADERGRTIY